MYLYVIYILCICLLYSFLAIWFYHGLINLINQDFSPLPRIHKCVPLSLHVPRTWNISYLCIVWISPSAHSRILISLTSLLDTPSNSFSSQYTYFHFNVLFPIIVTSTESGSVNIAPV